LFQDYIRDIDEIRIGFRTLAFTDLIRQKIIESDDVNQRNYVEFICNYSFLGRTRFFDIL